MRSYFVVRVSVSFASLLKSFCIHQTSQKWLVGWEAGESSCLRMRGCLAIYGLDSHSLYLSINKKRVEGTANIDESHSLYLSINKKRVEGTADIDEFRLVSLLGGGVWGDLEWTLRTDARACWKIAMSSFHMRLCRRVTTMDGMVCSLSLSLRRLLTSWDGHS